MRGEGGKGGPHPLGTLPRSEEPLPRLGAHPNTFHIRALGGPPGRRIVYVANRHTPSIAEVWEALMGFHVGDTGSPDLSQNQRTHLLGRYTDLNDVSWAMVTIRAHLVPTEDTSIGEGFTHQGEGRLDLLPTSP